MRHKAPARIPADRSASQEAAVGRLREAIVGAREGSWLLPIRP